MRNPFENRINLAADIAHVADRGASVQGSVDRFDRFNIWTAQVPPMSWLEEVT